MVEAEDAETRKMRDFMQFAMDEGLVEMCLDEEEQFAYYIPEAPAAVRIMGCPPPRRRRRHWLVASGMLSLALVGGVTLGSTALKPMPFRKSSTEMLTGVSLTSPVFVRLATRLELVCDEDRPGHADCTGPALSAEVFEHIGGDNTEFTFVSHAGASPGDQTVIRVFGTPAAANRWMGQVRSLTPYPNLVASGAIVAFGTSPTLVTRATAEAPTPPKIGSQGLLAGLFENRD